MLRIAFLGMLLAVGANATPAAAQTRPTQTTRTTPPTKPVPATATKPTSDGQGEYVAPGMSGAPNDRVTTDYENRPLKKPAAGTSTMSSQPKPKPTPSAKKTN